jgi:HSP20 family protein
MRVQRQDPWSLSSFDRFNTLREQFNRLFDSSFGDLTRSTEFFNDWVPALDLYETKDELVVRLEVPGMRKEEIEISLNEGTLTMSGERHQEQKEETGEAHRTERYYGRFQRSVVLPKPVKADRVKATYKDGVLTVELPKTEEAKPKQIEINVK